jgi:serine phosphatase RsbU (regulator of sigma subunit)
MNRAVAIAAAAAILVYFVATTAEILIIEALRPSEMELTWISDLVLAVAFGSAMFLWLNLRSTRLSLSRLEREHIVLDTQLSVAADIQRGLLPPVPQDENGIRWAARLVQAGRIGGDVYDFFKLAEGVWLILVGDVSGKGVPAALVHSSIRTMFRMITGETSDPAELAARISDRLHQDYGGTPYFTCVIVRLDAERRELTCVNAGHPAALLLDGQHPSLGPTTLTSSGPPAGLFERQRYVATTVPMGAARSLCLIVTDGITEAFDVLDGEHGDSVTNLLAHLPTPATPQRVCDALIECTAPALAAGDWQDDRTVVAFAIDLC